MQAISLSKKEDKQLIEQIERIAEKEKRNISDVILSFLKTSYKDYTSRKINDSNSPSVVSLFAGAGGLDVGLEMAGFEVIWANEIDKDAADTYEANHPRTFVERGDIRNVIDFPKADLLVGGYPCQGFSLAGNRLLTDDRNFLYKEFLRALRRVKPKFFIAENVKGLLTLSGGKVIEAMVDEFKEEGYNVNYHLVNAKEYGVPQDRERVFIIGVREDINFKYHLPLPTHGEGLGLKSYRTLKDAIGHLKPTEIGEYDDSGFSSRFLSRNRKRRWDEVSFCIQASGRHAPLHPSGEEMIKKGKDEWILPETSEHRKLSYIECALIQTFPANYIWKGSVGARYKQIGNAVPCLLAKAISKPILDFLNNQQDTGIDPPEKLKSNKTPHRIGRIRQTTILRKARKGRKVKNRRLNHHRKVRKNTIVKEEIVKELIHN
ncbi:DNA cytosine methyltransferase [Rossellomorea vietnamensis]|uniref:DNA cytosine methyltransferase n=1 Tax=Rossellomorea vietnamensis TaxID=218284 RepID=UPI001E2E2284|nr:DNA cytosine methyltransferase [Rossellomorea vietnamensis]MCC5803800.1 DNA cytosine methyltransferase [Rossellomorea vietnamensis]